MALIVWLIAGCLIAAILVVLTVLIAIQEDRAAIHAMIIKGHIRKEKLTQLHNLESSKTTHAHAGADKRGSCQYDAQQEQEASLPRLSDALSLRSDLLPARSVYMSSDVPHEYGHANPFMTQQSLHRAHDLPSSPNGQPLSTIAESLENRGISWSSSAHRSTEYLVPYLDPDLSTAATEEFSDVDVESVHQYRPYSASVIRPDSSTQAYLSTCDDKLRSFRKLDAIPEVMKRPLPSVCSRLSACSRMDKFAFPVASEPQAMYTYV